MCYSADNKRLILSSPPTYLLSQDTQIICRQELSISNDVQSSARQIQGKACNYLDANLLQATERSSAEMKNSPVLSYTLQPSSVPKIIAQGGSTDSREEWGAKWRSTVEGGVITIHVSSLGENAVLEWKGKRLGESSSESFIQEDVPFLNTCIIMSSLPGLSHKEEAKSMFAEVRNSKDLGCTGLHP